MDRKWGGRRIANAIGVMALAGAVVLAGAAGVIPTNATAATATRHHDDRHRRVQIPSVVLFHPAGRAAVGGTYSVSDDNSSASVRRQWPARPEQKGASATAVLPRRSRSRTST